MDSDLKDLRRRAGIRESDDSRWDQSDDPRWNQSDDPRWSAVKPSSMKRPYKPFPYPELTYSWLHIQSGKTGTKSTKDLTEKDRPTSKAHLLGLLNKWNARQQAWKYWAA